MLRNAFKYYIKCIAVSVIGYIFGGFILSFLLTEVESVLTLFLPGIIAVIGIVIRIIVLNEHIKKSADFDFGLTSCLKMSIPALCLLILAVVILLCDAFINEIGNIMCISFFDNIKMIIWVLFPGALTVDGIIWNLSQWNDIVYYALLVLNILVYIAPIWIYMIWKNKKA